MNHASPKTVKIAFLAIIAIFLNILAAIITFNPEQPAFLGRIIFRTPSAVTINDFKTFSSEDEFKKYLASAPKEEGYYGIGGGAISTFNEVAPTSGFSQKNAPVGLGGGSGEPDRFSQTNVQVAGIDEPDIVKTDGKEIYFSGIRQIYSKCMNFYYLEGRFDYETAKEICVDVDGFDWKSRGWPESPSGKRGDESIQGWIKRVTGKTVSSDEKIMMPPYWPGYISLTETGLISAFPPADLAVDGKVDKQGDLLLSDNILIVLGGQEITGFDVANPKTPTQKWNMKLGENTSLVASRLYGDKVYLITRNVINEIRPCPYIPFSIDGVQTNIGCANIYHPIVPVPADTTFTATIINPINGNVEKTVSFVGSSSTSVIYMSENSIYATYSYSESIIKFFIGFAAANQDLFPASVIQKIQKLNTYDISENSKINEFQDIIQKYNNSLNSDDRLKLQSEMQNRMSDYYKTHQRELEKTGIVKINIDSFKVAATGSVPGYLLNNFSLDEYQGNLRVATTIGRRFGWNFSLGGQNTQTNDVYVLDDNMKTIGAIKDFGNNEQIYSARFIDDKGYVVTFRQTDPFFVMDLSNPKNPQMAGELKIPGYSSYLHPLDATHVLGVGMENGKVKISLFDVLDINNPVELDKYNLDEYWTDVSNNYHAFMIDKKHNIFFLPGSKGGYVFSYLQAIKIPIGAPCTQEGVCPSPFEKNEYKLTLQKAISQNSVKRAIYIDDYLYIIGDDKVTVLNESDWQKVNELDLNK